LPHLLPLRASAPLREKKKRGKCAGVGLGRGPGAGADSRWGRGIAQRRGGAEEKAGKGYQKLRSHGPDSRSGREVLFTTEDAESTER
jgi:hypothetical protein